MMTISPGRSDGARDEAPCPSPIVRTDVTDGTGAEERAVTGGDIGVLAEATVRAALAEARLSDLKAMLEEMRGGVEDLKRDRDEWRTPAMRLSLPKAERAPSPAPMTWWRWLRTTA